MMTMRAYHVCVLLLLCLTGGCAAATPAQRDAPKQGTLVQTGAQRADPGYIQYLERLSMLGADVELARIVSGSQLAWLRPASTPFPDSLLVLADTWLTVNPTTLLPENKRSAFASLAGGSTWQIMEKTNIRGLHITPTGAAGGLWAYGRNATKSGEDVIQYNFSESAGSDDDYRRLLDMANTNRRLLGLDLVPAATGLGPDFFLSTRNHRQFPGVYCMVELPQNVWSALPAVPNPWRGVALSEEEVRLLTSKQLLPPAMEQDKPLFGAKTGWAVTSEIHGVDGLMRRWVYRYYGSPDRPILNWEDPSTAARRVLSGSAIRSVGVLGGALVGMRLEGMYGLDAARSNRPSSAAPADEAAIAIGREVRRYGGWSWLRDELPLSFLQTLMPGGPDFVQDSIFSPGLEHALLTGNAALLRGMADEALRLGLDMRRFVHGMPSEEGINYTLPHLNDVASRPADASKQVQFAGQITPQTAAALKKNTLQELRDVVYAAKMSTPKGDDIPPLAPDRLYTTSAGVAALALGAGNADAVTKAMLPKIQNGHLLLAFFRAMQPGLFLLSGQDLAGTLPLSWYSMLDVPQSWDIALTSHGAYALTEANAARMVTSQGIAKAKNAYPAPDVQIQDSSSFASKLGRIVALRGSLQVAGGVLHGRFLTRASGSLALALLLPSNGRLSASPEAISPAVKHDGNTFHLSSAATPEDGVQGNGQQRAAKQRENDARVRAAIANKLVLSTASSGSGFTMESDSALITVYNFSQEEVTETLNLAATPTLSRILGKGAPGLVSESAKLSRQGNQITVTLPPWQGAAILMGRMPNR